MKIIISIPLLLLLISCEQKIEDLNQTGNINVLTFEDVQDNIDYGSIFKQTKFVFLETTQDCLIGQIRKVQIINDTIVLFDPVQNGIFRFNQETGGFIDKYRRIGKGPNEYIDLDDFDVDISSGNIYLLCDKKRVLILNPQLEILDEIILPFNCTRLAHFNNEKLFFYTDFYAYKLPKTDSMPQLILYDYKKDYQQGFFMNTMAKKVRLSSPNHFFRSETLTFDFTFDHSFYNLTPNGIEEYVVSFLNHHFDFNSVQNVSNIEAMDALFEAKDAVTLFKNIYMVNDWIYLTGVLNRRSIHGFYNTQTDIGVCGKNLGKENEYPFLKRVVGTFDEGIVGSISPSQYATSLKESSTNPILIEVDPNANPILCFNYVKN